MRYALCGLVLALTGLAPNVHAQVFKCAGPGGKLTFSDRPCDAGSSGRMIQRERTFEEKLQEREQAYDAELRKQGRRQAEQDQEWAQRRSSTLRPHASPPNTPSRAGWAERKARENAATSASSISNNGGRWDRAAEERRARERREQDRLRGPEPSSSTLTSCSGGFCYDDGGNVYTQSGGFLSRTDGRSCAAVGNMVHCD